MPTMTRHGGGCCGVRHIYHFSKAASEWNPETNLWGPGKPWTAEEILNVIRTGSPECKVDAGNGGRSRGKLVEAIITDQQFRTYPELAQAMKEAGFRLVSRFSNNTGGICNVLHRTTGGRDISQAARRNPHIRTLMS